MAEKYEAMVSLGMANSRMKDFYDVSLLARRFNFSGERLSEAIRATFARRRTPVPSNLPVALSLDFAGDREKQAQWQAFLRRTKLPDEADLDAVIDDLRAFLMPPTSAIAADQPFRMVWSPTNRWQPT